MKRYDLLIVDDEKRFANMLAKRLRLRGCHCEICYNGRQAVDLVSRRNFLLILLDLHLPDIYGTEVLARIKEIDSNAPVVIVTGHGTEKDRQACMQQGAYAFLRKPVGMDKLMSIVAQIAGMSP